MLLTIMSPVSHWVALSTRSPWSMSSQPRMSRSGSKVSLLDGGEAGGEGRAGREDGDVVVDPPVRALVGVDVEGGPDAAAGGQGAQLAVPVRKIPGSQYWFSAVA